MTTTFLKTSFFALALSLCALPQQPYPATAVPVQSSVGNPVCPTCQAEFVSYLQTSIANRNAVVLNGYNGASNPVAACAQWTTAAMQSRGSNLPVAPMPVPPAPQVLNTFLDGDNTVWVWQTAGPPAPPCNPLPPLVTNSNPPGTPDIGAHLYGIWWACLQDDTVEMNTAVTVTAGEIFASGYAVPLGMYTKIPGMIGCWYLKVQ